MNLVLARFEALRVFRQPLSWLLVLVLSSPLFLRLVLGDGTDLGGALFYSLMLGCMLSVFGHQRQREGVGADLPYFLSRAGTRTQVLVAHWVLCAVVGLAIWSAIAIAMGARGRLSATTQVRLSPAAVSSLIEAQRAPVVSSPDDVQRSRWLSPDRPAPFKRDWGVMVGLPGVAATTLVLTVLCFLLGLVSTTAGGPPPTRWRWWNFLGPVRLLQLTPVVVVWFFEATPLFDPASSRLRRERLFTTIYIHADAAVAIGLALIAFYGLLSLRSWRRADY